MFNSSPPLQFDPDPGGTGHWPVVAGDPPGTLRRRRGKLDGVGVFRISCHSPFHDPSWVDALALRAHGLAARGQLPWIVFGSESKAKFHLGEFSPLAIRVPGCSFVVPDYIFPAQPKTQEFREAGVFTHQSKSTLLGSAQQHAIGNKYVRTNRLGLRRPR